MRTDSLCLPLGSQTCSACRRDRGPATLPGWPWAQGSTLEDRVPAVPSSTALVLNVDDRGALGGHAEPGSDRGCDPLVRDNVAEAGGVGRGPTGHSLGGLSARVRACTRVQSVPLPDPDAGSRRGRLPLWLLRGCAAQPLDPSVRPPPPPLVSRRTQLACPCEKVLTRLAAPCPPQACELV